MIRDFSTEPEPREIDTDICIVGAGAAGITLAMELIGGGARVVLVEAGAVEFDAETQGLYDGESSGMPYWPLAACRLPSYATTTSAPPIIFSGTTMTGRSVAFRTFFSVS